MDHIPFRARAYVIGVILAGAALLVIGLPQAGFERPFLLLALAGASALAAAFKVTLPLTTGGSTMSVSYAVDFTSLLLLGANETMIVAGASALSQSHVNQRERSPIHRTLFNVASLIVTVQGAGLAWRLLSSDGAHPAATAVQVVGAAIAYFLLNTALVAAAIALSSGEDIASTWYTNFLWSAPGYFVGAGTAVLAAAVVLLDGWWVAPLAFAPMYLMYRTYKVYMGRIEDEQRQVQETSDLHLATIEALARAIDAKDHSAQSHIRRVQTYAIGVARALELSRDDIEAVKTAALLHDIGKLAVPEHILSKPGPLTEEEFQKIRIHPQVGAEIIAAVPFPYAVAPLVLSHHERWDGKGYPQGLAGEDIPIGARILTVVDYYDAVTNERPYHRPLTHESALELLKTEAGHSLDPRVVDVFVNIAPALMAEADAAEPLTPGDADPERARHHHPAGSNDSPENAYENIRRAHREIYALYEIAQSMGTSLGIADTMALVSSKLAKIVPWSGCALILRQADGTFRCRYAAGAAASLLRDVLWPGDRLAGLIGRQGRQGPGADSRTILEALGLSTHPELKSAIVSGLHAGDTLIGLLALCHPDEERYSQDHHRLLERVAEQAGPVIQNSVLFEQTQEDSLTDPLTSLPNRRSMFTRLSQELARAERTRTEVGLIVMDIDDFKAINDTYGHHVGDYTLREVGAALQAGLRPYDMCVRYAGDEFIVVLGECSRDDVDARRRELQARVGRIEIEVRKGKTVRLSASAGAALYPDDGNSYEELLAQADHRMYRDKAARRRKVPQAAAGFMAAVYQTPAPSQPPPPPSAARA
jgi:diguanylate cyclase (GGDEF)-like protein/putative nucleotidyltransferase with HDIG domain